ncbi:adenylate cyclase, class 3 [Desulfuromonas soudanensis]|uniref:Adenylate cyclase, class 3 n=1 Tax=Desulfuromonas soudanensis TaxID=1603606 RepID=A0A0M5ITR7_9BACT|nr:adenylate/guanylate cyclase domain-containing protein [Desulfuromonas soudanensis]ALC16256.1 adenylate cyclase, class 3 [Desulfuromonas soudanensis]
MGAFSGLRFKFALLLALLSGSLMLSVMILLDLQMDIISIDALPVRLGEIHPGPTGEVILGEVQVLRHRMAALSLAAMIGAFLLASFLAGSFLRPLRALARGVKAIGEGNFDQHIDLQRKDELGRLTSAFNDMATSLRKKKFIQSNFERYVSKPLSQQILEHKDELKLGGEEKEVTILFSDIRRFTALAEQLPPALVVELLNDYFTRVIAVVMQNEGMVDKLMGDSVMALFGAPISLGNDSLRAVRCALEMQQAVEVFNRERSARNLPPVEMGIGINTGTVIAGNIGSAERMEYTVIGDSVNIAARLQGLARPGEILISQATYLQVRDRVKATSIETMTLKGKSLTVAVYRLEGLG